MGRLGWYGLALMIGGGVICWQAWREERLAASASAAPEEISLASLIARGGQGNPNIVLREFRTGTNVVVEVEREGGPWRRVWVPVVPASEAAVSGQPSRPAVVRALLQSGRVKAEADFARLEADRLPGLVMNPVQSLDRKARKTLEEAYPGQDFARVLIIQEGGKLTEPGFVRRMLVLGVVLLLAGIILQAGSILRNSLAERRCRGG